MEKSTLTSKQIYEIEVGLNKYFGNNNNDIFRFGDQLSRHFINGKLYTESDDEAYSIYGKSKNETLEIKYVKNKSVRINIIDTKYNYYKELIYSMGKNKELQIIASEKQIIVDSEKHCQTGEILKNGIIRYDKDKKLISEYSSEKWRDFESETKSDIGYTNYNKSVYIHNISGKAFVKKENKIYLYEPEKNEEEYFITYNNHPGMMDSLGNKNKYWALIWKKINKEDYDRLISKNNKLKEQNKVKQK